MVVGSFTSVRHVTGNKSITLKKSVYREAVIGLEPVSNHREAYWPNPRGFLAAYSSLYAVYSSGGAYGHI